MSSYSSFWHGFNITAGILTGFFLLGLPLLFALAAFIGNVDVSARQNSVGAALEPTSFTIEVANPESVPLNAVEFELSYDPTVLSVNQIVPETTLCDDMFLISNTVNNASGTALFQCGTLYPFSAATGTVATVYATPLTSGTTTVSFGALTHVLAHDGYGTDMTHSKTGVVLHTL